MSRLTKSEILSKLIELKPIYEKEGIVLLGLFGSYARDEAKDDSDIDILYDVKDNIFCEKYPGFKSFSRLKDIKDELGELFGKSVDFATIDNDSKVFQDVALRDAIYV